MYILVCKVQKGALRAKRKDNFNSSEDDIVKAWKMLGGLHTDDYNEVFLKIEILEKLADDFNLKIDFEAFSQPMNFRKFSELVKEV